MSDVDRAISQLAARQHGVVHLCQLRGLGLPKAAVHKRVAAGLLHRRFRASYAVGHPRLSQRGEWMAGVLAVSPDAWLTGLSAATLYGVWRRRVPEHVEVLTTSQRGQAEPGLRVTRTRHVDPADVAIVDAIPVVGFARLLLELAAILTARQLANVIHEGEYHRLFDPEAARAVARRACGNRHLHVLCAALAMHERGSAGTFSYREDELFRRLAAARLPEPLANVTLTIDGRRSMVDMYLPDHRLVIEVDGPGHERTRTKREDKERDRLLKGAGIHVERFTIAELPDAPDKIATLLARRAVRAA
ncbi:MAG TPA: type IV toxin-antitoxin system AbiEi family antitoxin domain-containing protein [Solirubrobacteraceae bacterium]|jgi:very-short-patch-repair endonuclease|nr:type IV toxin-antitoxin system AbiEi family antitoxin domain-containing protein [Solirubrobacteraceae bacterium]